MQRQAFDYYLPEELIAKKPAAERRGSRLLCLDGVSGKTSHQHFDHILECVEPGDLLVFNDTRVIPARLFGQKETGGQVEILLERVLNEREALAHVRASKSPKPGAKLAVEGDYELLVGERVGELFSLSAVEGPTLLDILNDVGHMPLPPYIDRDDDAEDLERYQTVYAKENGAVAAPTAGLHFDEPMLKALEDKGATIGFVTLHVGAGTFQPVRADDIREHQMHSEIMVLDDQLAKQVAATKAAGKRVIAVGTTSVRCLETAASTGEIAAYSGETDIFIYPGYDFKVVDALVTNFHLPESTLLMLVCAFAGYVNTIAAYREAVAQEYRFFSYGDAMFIERNPAASKESIYMTWDR